MPDAIEMLTQEHREVEQLFEQYRQTQSTQLVEEICTQLTLHTKVEEQVIYPALSSGVANGQDLRQHAEEEHQEVTEAILEVERLGYAGPEVDQLMQKIISGVTEHVEEEEGQVFPRMRQDLGEEEIQRLGSEAQAAKRSLESEMGSKGPLIDLTKDELYNMAKEKGIEGRSQMTKDQLISALSSS
jgi:hemerythrin superfamily protein